MKEILVILMASAAAAGAAQKVQMGRLPLSFERMGNGYLARGDGYLLELQPEAIRINSALTMRAAGAQKNAALVAEDRQTHTANYLTGNEKAWRRGVAQYGRVRYREIYPGIDLVFYGNRGQFEYDFVVAPGADPKRIAVEFSGAQRLAVAADGALELKTNRGLMVHHKPFVYQETGARRKQIAARYIAAGPGRVGFALGDYDCTKPLVIDPVLQYASYLGGRAPANNADDQVNATAVDTAGNIYVAGRTMASDLPLAGAIQKTNVGSGDAFVMKLDPTGTKVIWATYLGGASLEYAYALAVDSLGQVHLTGVTGSHNFPVKKAYQSTKTGLNILFITKLNAEGNGIVFSTYLGGERNDTAYGIGVDRWGNTVVAGRTNSAQFPLKAAMQSKFGGGYDGIMAKFGPEGELIYSTYVGGSGNDEIYGLAVDEDGNAFVAGATQSPDLATGSAFSTKPQGRDAFAGKLTPAGNAWSWFTYLGGRGSDEAHSIAFDGFGRVYVGGYTTSVDFPVTVNAFQRERAGTSDGFVAKLNENGTAIEWASYLGGTSPAPAVEDEYVSSIAVDGDGAVYAGGTTVAQDFPVTRAVQEKLGGKRDAFVAKIAPEGHKLVFATYVGGTAQDDGLALAVTPLRAVYIAGQTWSNDIPTVAPFSSSRGGNSDAFLARICDPVLFVSEESIEFEWTQGTELPRVRHFGAKACMDLDLNVEMEGSPAWLTIDARTPQGGAMPLEARVNPEGLEPGEYTTTLRLSAPETWFPPRTVRVTLRVAPPPPPPEEPVP
jgi:hypothetical protein